MKYSKDMIMQVRELMERHCDVVAIAHRLNFDVSDVQTIIEIIKQVVT
jgi:hypothetical protein